MPVMCANVARGSLIDSVEEYINGFDDSANAQSGDNKDYGNRRPRLREDLEGSTPLAKLLQTHLIEGCDATVCDHLRQHWFDDGSANWWPHNEQKEAVVRHGLAEAIRIREEEGNRPVCILWTCAGHHFQVAVHNSEAQITVMILTPHTPYGVSYPASKRATNITVIGTKRDIDEIVREAGHAKGNPTKAECECVNEDPEIWKVPVYGA